MNRYELLTLTAIAIAAIIFLIKSKRFDRFVKSLIHGSKPTTAEEIKEDAARVTNSIRTRNQELVREENNLRKEKKVLKDL